MKRIRLNFALDPRLIHTVLCAAVFATILIGTFSAFLQQPGSQSEPYSFFSYFAMGRGNTVPAFLSSFNLLLASFLLVIAAQLTASEKVNAKGSWYGLALVCFTLSVNEIAGLHEVLFDLSVNQWTALTGYSHYALIVIGALALLFAMGLAIKLFISVPAKTRRGFLLSGLVFAAGVLGVEVIGYALYEVSGSYNEAYLTSIVVEESLEMLGVLLFIRSLLVYLSGVQTPEAKQEREQHMEKTLV